MFTSHISNTGLSHLECIRNTQYQQYSIFKPPNKKRAKDSKKHLTRAGIQMANKYTKGVPHH